jgi:tRNA(Met) C34 N-acetyltransferase TmcA
MLSEWIFQDPTQVAQKRNELVGKLTDAIVKLEKATEDFRKKTDDWMGALLKYMNVEAKRSKSENDGSPNPLGSEAEKRQTAVSNSLAAFEKLIGECEKLVKAYDLKGKESKAKKKQEAEKALIKANQAFMSVDFVRDKLDYKYTGESAKTIQKVQALMKKLASVKSTCKGVAQAFAQIKVEIGQLES